MARILVFQHSDIGTPGRLGLTLRDHGFRLDIRRPDRDGVESIPPDLDNVHGVVSLGGPQSANDADAWVAREQAFLRAAHEAELPVVGICLGAQMIGKALGGTVSKLDEPEVGYLPISVEVPGQTDTLLAGMPWNSRVFQHHGETVSQLPEGASKLASSPAGVQVFRAGIRTIAFQFHLEATPAIAEAIARDPRSADLNARAGLDADAIVAQTEEFGPRFNDIANRLCVNLATYCFPFARLTAV
ncbi:MAG: type 1 glutamine amidotransferase [Phycisphaerales bacterium JB037]